MARESTILIGLAGLAGASLFWLRGEDVAARPDAPTALMPTDTPEVAPAEPATGTVETAEPEPATAETHSHQLELPDGTFVDALNSAVDPAPLATYWGPTPYSPIVGIESAGGIDWYRHEDGSYSTTQMVWRSDLGRHAAMTRVAHPGPTPAPTAVSR